VPKSRGLRWRNSPPAGIATAPETVVDTLWNLITDHSEPHLHAIVTATASHPTLRTLRPWISHGTLHLLHPDDAVSGERRGLAFHPFGEADFRVRIYGGPFSLPEDAASAVIRAAATAAAW
jgi:hypothetical protein